MNINDNNTIKKLYDKYFINKKNITFEIIEKTGKSLLTYSVENKYGFIISDTGINSNYSSVNINLSWEEFKKVSIGYHKNNVFLGSFILTFNGETKMFYKFFKKLQKGLNLTSVRFKREDEAFKLLEESKEKLITIEEKLDFYISIVEDINDLRLNILK